MTGAELSDQTLLGMAGVPLIVALTGATRRAFPGLPARWRPVVALAWALLVNAGLGTYLGGDPVLGAATGLVAALTASGLYSAGRTLSRRHR